MLQEAQESNIKWLNISNGQLTTKTSPDDPKAQSRINKVGNKVYERFYRAVAGKITQMELAMNNFDELDIKVFLKNEEDAACLTIKFDSSYGRAFLAQIFNADLSRTIQFTPWQKVVDDGTKKTRLYLSYGMNKPVEWKLPAGTPQVKWVEVKGKSIIDSVSQAENLAFLEEKLNEFIISNGLKVEREERPEPVELTAEEMKELKSMKRNAKKSNVESQSAEDFFNDL